ncbi:unnamed protein product, partial [Prorocentrum cordatum]
PGKDATRRVMRAAGLLSDLQKIFAISRGTAEELSQAGMLVNDQRTTLAGLSNYVSNANALTSSMKDTVQEVDVLLQDLSSKAKASMCPGNGGVSTGSSGGRRERPWTGGARRPRAQWRVWRRRWDASPADGRPFQRDASLDGRADCGPSDCACSAARAGSRAAGARACGRGGSRPPAARGSS